jgi:hypothetical protein
LKKYDEQTYYAYTLRNSINELKKIYQKDIMDKNIKTFYETYLEGFREVENKDLYRVEGDKNTLQNLILLTVGRRELKLLRRLLLKRFN